MITLTACRLNEIDSFHVTKWFTIERFHTCPDKLVANVAGPLARRKGRGRVDDQPGYTAWMGQEST